MNRVSIGFLGAGKMATALARGVISAGVVPAERVLASDLIPAARLAFAQATGARVTDENAEVLDGSDIVVVAVKPDQVVGLFGELASRWNTGRHLVVSIAAGVPFGSHGSCGPQWPSGDPGDAQHTGAGGCERLGLRGGFVSDPCRRRSGSRIFGLRRVGDGSEGEAARCGDRGQWQWARLWFSHD